MYSSKLKSAGALVRASFLEEVHSGIFNIQTRSYRLKGFRGRSGVKLVCKKPRAPQIPLSLLNPDFEAAPVSGSVVHGDIAEERETSREFIDDVKSLTARGFHRFQKAYEPPENAREKFLEMVRDIRPSFRDMTNEQIKAIKLEDNKLKYDILAKACDEFQHAVPNSLLHVFPTIGAVSGYYATPVRTSTPFDDLVNNSADLPPNLFVQKDPIRFTDETSHYFGGRTAFPKSSTIITGLRAKEKYEAYKAKKQWP
jgi:large subunit ribosomal protein L50